MWLIHFNMIDLSHVISPLRDAYIQSSILFSIQKTAGHAAQSYFSPPARWSVWALSSGCWLSARAARGVWRAYEQSLSQSRSPSAPLKTLHSDPPLPPALPPPPPPPRWVAWWGLRSSWPAPPNWESAGESPASHSDSHTVDGEQRKGCCVDKQVYAAFISAHVE